MSGYGLAVERNDARLFDPAAEAAYLGMLLLAPGHFAAVKGQIRAGDFTRQQHRAVYEAMAAVERSGRTPDVTLVMGELAARGHERREVTDVVGLLNEAPTPARLRDFGLTIREAAVRRRLLQLGQFLASAAYAPDGVTGATEKARRWLDAIEDRLGEQIQGLYPGTEDWEPREWPRPQAQQQKNRWQGVDIPL